MILLGFGSLGARLCQLLRPFTLHIWGVRRQLSGDETIPTLRFDDPKLPELLAQVDHMVNLLPAADGTKHFFDAQRLGFQTLPVPCPAPMFT